MRNLPNQITEKQVEHFFRPYLAQQAITTFSCRKRRNQGVATITIVDVRKAENFLLQHGQTIPGREGFSKVKQKLFHMKKPINCCQSNNPPDKFLLQSLDKEEKNKLQVDESQNSKANTHRPKGLQKKFDIVSLSCGQWDYENGRLVFMSHFQERRKGLMVFAKQFLRIDLDPTNANRPSHRLEIPYDTVENFATGSPADPAVTISLSISPKIFEDLKSPAKNALMDAVIAIGKLSFENQPQPKNQQVAKRKRISAINKNHEAIVSSCLCYRLVLQQSSEISNIQALRKVTEIPQSVHWNSDCIMKNSFPVQMTLLNTALAGKKFETLSFDAKFQFQKLVQNGHLPPARVIELLKQVTSKLKGVDDATLVASVRKLSTQIPYAGPHTDPNDLKVETLIDLLIEIQGSIERESFYSAGLVEQHSHLALIHKALVTPTGTYLFGPEPEVKNRVLRKYSAFSNYFLQVTFQDENGEPLRYDRQVSNEDIYHRRFKNILEGVIIIVGRGYEVSYRKALVACIGMERSKLYSF